MKHNEITLNHSINCNSIEDNFRQSHHGLLRNNGMRQQLDYEHQNNNLHLVINSENTKKIPDHFRKTTDLTSLKGFKAINLSGLVNLNISGSSQFSENGLILIKQSLGNAMPIIIVDLRQESHGFINGVAVSWRNNHNKVNKGLTKAAVLSDENTKLQSILLNKPISIDGKSLVPKKLENEEELVQRYGMSYIRIPVTDKEIPDNEMVDYFIKFVNSLPPNTWLHFHCKAGGGRTVTFIAMYDMMKNAKNVSLHDLMNRQVLLGKKSVLGDEQLSRSSSELRVKLIKRFYRYCVENNDKFKTSWSQWLKL